jgi:hypothetical protein
MKSTKLLLGIAVLLAATTARSDIFRWDTGEVIPGYD